LPGAIIRVRGGSEETQHERGRPFRREDALRLVVMVDGPAEWPISEAEATQMFDRPQ
jgi:hypothetical protein